MSKERPWIQGQTTRVLVLISLCTYWDEPEQTPFPLLILNYHLSTIRIPSPALNNSRLAVWIKLANLKNVKHNRCPSVTPTKPGTSVCLLPAHSKHCVSARVMWMHERAGAGLLLKCAIRSKSFTQRPPPGTRGNCRKRAEVTWDTGWHLQTAREAASPN